MKHRLALSCMVFLAGAAMAVAAPLYRAIPLDGWQPVNVGDYFLTPMGEANPEGLGLSHDADFSVAARVTFPETLASKAAVLSLGDPATHQITLTVYPWGTYAYLSSAAKEGGTNVLLGEWKIPTGEDGLDPALVPGKTYDIALTYAAATKTFALWVNGKQQSLTLNTAAVNSKDDDPSAPKLKRDVAFPALRLSGRIYEDNIESFTFAGGRYANVGVFGFALNETQVAQLHEADITLSRFIAKQDGVISVDLSAGDDATTAWQPEWNGKVVILRGTGTLEVSGTATPKECFLADGTALTVRCKMGDGIIVEDLLTLEGNASVSAEFTGLPETSGTYTVLSDKAQRQIPPLASALPPEIPEGSAAYLPDEWLSAGTVSIAIIPTDTDGAYLLGSPLDYEWYLAACPMDATVRLSADITLEPKAYTAKPEFGGTFDGAGHTLTFPEGATMEGEKYAGLICGTTSSGAAFAVKNLRVCAYGALTAKGSSCGTLVGGCGAYADTNTQASFENLHVIVGGALTAASSGGGAGGIVGDFWGTWTGKGPMRNLRVDLLPTARLTAPYSGEGGRGAGGVMGAAASPVALENVLVVLQAGVTFDAPEKWRGGVMARQRGTYSAQAITVVDFGTPATHYLATGGNVEGLRLFRASAATAAMPEGTTPVLLETGSFSARDGATRALLSGTEEDLLLLPEPTPEDAAWAMAPAEGANTVTVTPTDSTRQNPGATLPLEYTFRAMDEAFAEETLWSPTVTAVCTPTMLSDDGAIELRSASDYEWYLEACPNGATVRMTQDITLPPKTYQARTFTTLTFDGNGHTLTFPSGATINGTGATTGQDYCGLVAGQLHKGEIKDVTVVVGGKVWAKPYAGAVLGATVWGGTETVSLSGVRVRLLEGGEISATPGSGNNAYAGGIVGRNYHNPAILSGCAILLEQGARLTNANSNEAKWKQTGAVCGGLHQMGREQGVTVMDLGVIMPEGSCYSNDASGDIRLFKASDVTTDYGISASGTPQAFLLRGQQEGVFEDGLLRLSDSEAAIVKAGSVKAVNGDEWALRQEGNAVTVTEGPGGRCELTYGVEGFEDVAIPVAFTPMALAELPEGTTATPEQRTRLMAEAAQAGLPLPAKVAFRTHAESPTFEALDVFDGILRADKETGTLILGYDFGIVGITPKHAEADGPTMLNVTIRVQGDQGAATFAEGTTIDLVRISDGSSLLEAPVSPTPGTSEILCSFPLKADTECFRVKASKTQETP